MGRFDSVLTDPEYSALDDNQKLQVWDGLFKKHVATDPEYAALNDEQKRNAYDQFVRKYYTPGQSKPVSIEKVNINTILPGLQESPLQKTKVPVSAVSPVDTNAPMNQEQAAQMMGISQSQYQRDLTSVMQKITEALINGCAISITKRES